MSAADYRQWLQDHLGEAALPGLDCAGYVEQVMRRVSELMGWPEPQLPARSGYHDQQEVAGCPEVTLTDAKPGDLIDRSGDHIMMITSRTTNRDGSVTIGITECSDTAKYGVSQGIKVGTFTFKHGATSLAQGELSLPGYGPTHLGQAADNGSHYHIYRPTYWLRKDKPASSMGVADGLWGRIAANKECVNIPQWKQLILAAAERYGVPPVLIAAIMMHENHGINALEVNASGDAGVMQLNLNAQNVTLAQATDPAFAIDHATKYLAGLIKMFHGDFQKAIQAYNYGEGNVQDLVETYQADWMSHRNEVRNADPQYYEHVMHWVNEWGGNLAR